jgi:hypothetical protein
MMVDPNTQLGMQRISISITSRSPSILCSSHHRLAGLTHLAGDFYGPLSLERASILPLLIAPSDSSSDASLVVPPGPRHSQPQLALELTDHRGFGGLWDTFTAHTTSSLYHFWTSRSSHNPSLSSTSRRHSYSSPRPRSQRQSLILKLTCPVDFPVDVGCSYSRTLLSRDEARHDVLLEASIMAGPLASQQGEQGIVPHFEGLFGSLQVARGGVDGTHGDLDLEGNRGTDGGALVEVWCAMYGDAGVVMSEGEKRVEAVRSVPSLIHFRSES